LYRPAEGLKLFVEKFLYLKGDRMRTNRVLPLAACLAILLVLPSVASACSSGCLYPGGCGVCTYLGEGSGGSCIQYDTCVCYDVQCGFAGPQPQEGGELGALEELLGLGATQSMECPAQVVLDLSKA
jgi:hypothetical protein